MSKRTNIEWTDHTFNGWRGCTKVSPGCAHCYAETLSKRNPAVLGNWGKGAPRVLGSDHYWDEPLSWESDAYYGAFRQCPECGWRGAITLDAMPCPTEGCECVAAEMETVRPRVFSASLADWLDDDGVPIEWLVRLLRLVHRTPDLDWLLLTKRPQNWKERINRALIHAWQEEDETGTPFSNWLEAWFLGTPPKNIWIGATVEDQERAMERIPRLLQIPALVRFLSCEPLLGFLDLPKAIESALFYNPDGSSNAWSVPKWPLINWVIAGGESGPDARPMHPDWARGVRDQCHAAAAPFLFKQWGDWKSAANSVEGIELAKIALKRNPPMCQTKGSPLVFMNVGKKAAGRILDGKTYDGFPTLPAAALYTAA